MRVDVVRVFCDERGGFGNALGLVVTSEVTAGREQAIAARLGYSETVVIDELPTGHARRARIRIFTPAVEMPFAGHPTVGTAWWLAAAGMPVDVLDVPAGAVEVRAEGDLTLVAARPTWAPAFSLVELDSPRDVDGLLASSFTEGSHYAWSWLDEGAGTVRARMFAPALGVAEDEATGAAAVRSAALGRALEIHQGAGSRLATRPLPDGRVEGGGRVVAAGAVELVVPDAPGARSKA
jgi:predicted PhzF superfamily epimerase YddE/YHI9